MALHDLLRGSWILLLLPACAVSPAPEPVLPAGLDEAALRLAWEMAAEEGDWERVVAVRQRLAALEPGDVRRRLAVAQALRQAGYRNVARREAEVLLRDPRVAEGAAVLLAELDTAEGEFLLAAARYEALAEGALTEAAQRGYFERAARMAELGGDDARAVEALDRALNGMNLREGEQRVLDRLRAFHSGDFRHAGDAAEVVRRHPDASVRLLAVDYLLALEGEEALLGLADALFDPEPQVVLAALPGVEGQVNPFARAALAEAMDHPERSVRLAATRAFTTGAEASELVEVVNRLDPEDRQLFRLQCHFLETHSGNVLAAPLGGGLEARQALADAWQAWWNEQR